MENLEKRVSPDVLMKEEIQEAYLEVLFLNLEKINEGTNGVIALIDINKLSLEFKKFLFNDEGEKGIVMKILKIYEHGKGRKEYEMQKKAFQVLSDEGKEVSGGLAKIPKPLYYKEVELRSETAIKKIFGNLA
ncbi:MAG: hypothetical protein ACD_63C00252G0002 [uncultured bacterium]|nr:MAG: hypothetical protein ACD_63C00252G0002 [uncultured bacterium]